VVQTSFTFWSVIFTQAVVKAVWVFFMHYFS
jgi:hypothetical protein